MEARLDGGLEVRRRSVERRRRSGVWGGGKSKRVRGKDQGEPPGSDARERKERRALSWPGHGGVEVATGGLTGGARHGLERYSARGQWVQGSRGVTRGAAVKLELACGRPRAAGGRRSARRQRSRAGKLEEEEKVD